MRIIDPLAKLLGEWASSITIGSMFLRLGLSLILSAIIGCERSSKRHSAGLRTFMILSLATTLAGMIDMFLIESYDFKFAFVSLAVVIACAMLSNNVILFTSKSKIKGLTTSVGFWACGVIGLCIGLGFYTISIIATAILLFTLSIIPSIEMYLKNRSNHFEISVELDNKSNLSRLMSTLRELGLRIDELELDSAYLNSGVGVYIMCLTIVSEDLKKYKTHKEIIEAIKSIDYVKHAEELK